MCQCYSILVSLQETSPSYKHTASLKVTPSCNPIIHFPCSFYSPLVLVHSHHPLNPQTFIWAQRILAQDQSIISDCEYDPALRSLHRPIAVLVREFPLSLISLHLTPSPTAEPGYPSGHHDRYPNVKTTQKPRTSRAMEKVSF